ncbi:MAG: YraN family protein [Gemmatimonadota bacterium]
MGGRNRTGRRGEALAAEYLKRRGWRILDRNWRAGHRELDLVVRRASVVAFVEVKTRAHGGCGGPLESVTRHKRREIERAAAAWLQAEAGLLEGVATLRFDALAVHLNAGRSPRFRHVPDAWRIGDD